MSTPTLIPTASAASAPGARGAQEALEQLRQRSDVVVLTPEDAGFDAARHAWNAAVSHQPDVVAMPTSAQGVAAVVKYAREQRQSLAIQATGHGPTRTVTSGVLVNLSRLNQVSVDPVARTATIHGGAKWQALLEVAAPLGLTPLLGSTPDVSAIGYTLGGGLGWLGRKYGTAADSVREFDLVTATGELVTVTAESDPDLFWALRGAGAGHLGVVTRMVIELYPISELYAGNLIYPGSMAADVLRRWRDWLPSLPEALTSAVTVLNYPDIDEVPEAFRGKPFVHVRGAFDGPAEEGAALMEYWRTTKSQPDACETEDFPFCRERKKAA
jgi:FAD/FMN-containing dehydrogenase